MSEFGTALDETPENINFLSPLIYKFQIKKTPNLNFFVQNVNLPGIHLPPTEGQPNKFVNIPYWGDHLTYDEIMINFKVQESMADWLEVHNWIRAMGFPREHAEYAALSGALTGTGDGLTSDISLIIMNSARNPKFNIIFRDAFPVSLSSTIFDQAVADINYVTAAATFKYTLYDIEEINV
ncbi:MAG: hypothetical protein ACR2PH_04520 [Desulfobulbia bacterium]